MSKKGRFLLIPNTLGGTSINETIPPVMSTCFNNTSLILVEKDKVARRFLIELGLKDRLDEFQMVSIKHGVDKEIKSIFQEHIDQGKDVALISDAGCPAVADPGHEIVALAHSMKIDVKPMTGPSSIILALMASGFNGQNFAFHGYLPKEINKRKDTIRRLERNALRNDQTQLFIETPFRNQYLLKDLVQTCEKNTKICLAVDLTTENEWIKTASVSDWKSDLPDIHKKQCIFLIYK